MKKIFLTGALLIGALTLTNSITFAAPSNSSNAPTCTTTKNVTVRIVGNDKVSIHNQNDTPVNVTWEVWGTNSSTGQSQRVGGAPVVVKGNAEDKFSFSCPSNVSGLWVVICNVD